MIKKLSIFVTGFFFSTILWAADQSSPPNSLVVAESGNVGVGTDTPGVNLEVIDNNTTVGPRVVFQVSNNGGVGFNMEERSSARIWRFATQPSGFRVSLDGTGGPEMEVRNDGSVQLGGGGNQNFLLTASGDLFLAGTVSTGSDRATKKLIEPVDGRDILAKLDQLSVSHWVYERDGSDSRHIGPMAQDFAEVFSLGADDKHISATDLSGVALAAIQGLQKEMQDKDEQIAMLRNLLLQQQRQIDSLEATMKANMKQYSDTRNPEFTQAFVSH